MLTDHFLNVLPVGNNQSLETKLVAQDVRQYVMAGVNGDTVDLARIYHDAARSGINRGLKRWHEIFAQINLGNPRGRAIPTGERETVTHVMFQTRGNMIFR